MVQKIATLSIFILLCTTGTLTAEVSPLQKILAKENSSYHRKNIQAIIDKCEDRYEDLYTQLENGGKITVFFDPAHGQLSSRNWQGDVTWRQSTTDKPEEFYSIPLSRYLYKYMTSNKYIRVASTRNYMEMLQGERDDYYNIPFSKTTTLADKTDSFIIVSSHLNNISPINKADGKVNMYGIHITCDEYGTRYLTHVQHVSRGFLTLYNSFDGSGFCRTYAENLRSDLIDIDMYPNAWGKGVVSDGRFTFFSNYPLSVIYETAFISNPVEERFLRIPNNQRLIARAQYQSLIKSISETFGVDISDGKLKKRFNQPKQLTERIALSQIAVYYLKNKVYDRAAYACRLTSAHANNEYVKEYYASLASRVEKADSYIALAEKNKRSTSTWGKYMLKAAKALGNEHITSNMRKDLYAQRAKKLGIKSTGGKPYRKKLGAPPEYKPLSVAYETHSYKTPFILTIKPGQSLDDAIAKAISPNLDIEEKVYASFEDVKVTKVKWVRKYSQKKKKYYWKKEQYSVRKTFEPGIYIIRLNKDYSVSSVKNVKKVPFDPTQYQNQEYFKNSSIAAKTKERSL